MKLIWITIIQLLKQAWLVPQSVAIAVKQRRRQIVLHNGLVCLELNRALEQEHFEVLWTATTREAVAACNRRHIDLLLLDRVNEIEGIS